MVHPRLKKLIPAHFVPTKWMSVPPGPAREATQETAEKLAWLARVVEHYVQAQIDERLGFLDGGTIIITTGAACPAGWEEDTTWRDRFLQGPDSTGGSIGSTGGTANHTHNVTPSTTSKEMERAGDAAVVYATGATVTSTAADNFPPFKRALFCKKKPA